MPALRASDQIALPFYRYVGPSGPSDFTAWLTPDLRVIVCAQPNTLGPRSHHVGN